MLFHFRFIVDNCWYRWLTVGKGTRSTGRAGESISIITLGNSDFGVLALYLFSNSMAETDPKKFTLHLNKFFCGEFFNMVLHQLFHILFIDLQAHTFLMDTIESTNWTTSSLTKPSKSLSSI